MIKKNICLPSPGSWGPRISGSRGFRVPGSQGPRIPGPHGPGSQDPVVPGSWGPGVCWSRDPKIPGSQVPGVLGPGSHFSEWLFYNVYFEVLFYLVNFLLTQNSTFYKRHLFSVKSCDEIKSFVIVTKIIKHTFNYTTTSYWKIR